MLEEGTVATPYEEYKEFQQDTYLDEPLYYNNELCVVNKKLGYWKNYAMKVFYGGDDEKWLIGGNSKFLEIQGIDNILNSKCICDKLPYDDIGLSLDSESINIGIRTVDGGIRIRPYRKSNMTLEEGKLWLQNNTPKVVHALKKPYFVPVLENTPSWVLECFNNCEVQFETNVPILSSSFFYTSNIPSVVKLDKINYEQDQVTLDNAYKLTVLEIATGITI